MIPLGRSNLYKNEMCPAESVVCSKKFTIASTSPHHTVDAGRNCGLGGGLCNTLGGFVRGAGVLYEVLGGVYVSLVGFEVDVPFFCLYW